MVTYEKEAQKLLRKLGANGSYLGYKYTAYGIAIAIQDPDLLLYVCKGLYVDISFHFNTDIKNVERNIRTIKNLVWERGNKDMINDIFSFEIDRCPTNAFFIDALANYLAVQNEE